ncbi:hypothetical protein JCM19992_14180 [Thermostilla marina]
MDFLNKAIQQLRDLFASMTPATRITTGVLLAVLVSSLGFLFTQHASGPDVYLMNGEHFSPSDLPAMEAAFAAKGLSDYTFEGTRIRVPAGKQDEYMAALAEGNALPSNYLDILDNTLKEASPWESKYRLAERIKVAKQKEFSRVVSEMSGVQNAVVMFNTTNKGGLRNEEVTTASVAVKPEGGRELPDKVVRAIRYFVAMGFGIKPEDVVVTNMETGANYYASPDDPTHAAEDTLALKQSAEEYFAAKVRQALGYVTGALVSCNVELDPTKYHREEQVTYDPKPVAASVTETTKSRQVQSPSQGGRVGFVAQGNTPRTLNTSSSTGPQETEEETERVEQNNVGQTVVQQETAGLMPKQVTVSVAVPASYFRKVWEQSKAGDQAALDQGPTQQELDQIRVAEIAKITSHVAAVLPPVAGVNDPTQLVTVTEFADVPVATLEGPGFVEQMTDFLYRYWTTIGLMGLALVSLVVLRSTIRSGIPAPTTTIEMDKAPPMPEEEEEEEEPESELLKLRKSRGTSMSLRDELAAIVSEDPDTAAEILKTWIGTPV